MPGRRGLFALGACFFLSGMGSLALEVVWTRQMRLVFGSTTLAASTILVAYMLGLGVGGLLGGRVASRLRDGVRAYGTARDRDRSVRAGRSLAAGAAARAEPLAARRHGVLAGGAVPLRDRPLPCCSLPTVLMGATLPIVVAALVRRDPRIGASTGLLYGLNTLGAVAGVFLATFVFFPLLGLTWTNWLGALLDLAVGVLALAVVAREVRAWPALAAAAPAAGRGDGDRRVVRGGAARAALR